MQGWKMDERFTFIEFKNSRNQKRERERVPMGGSFWMNIKIGSIANSQEGERGWSGGGLVMSVVKTMSVSKFTLTTLNPLSISLVKKFTATKCTKNKLSHGN